jgi:hypothetical protein
MEEFCVLEDFPDYMVTSYGRVIKDRVYEMTRSPTAYGDMTVGLTFRGRQSRRSVKGLVARAFVPGETLLFDTPVLLDGDRENIVPENIVWRPRWFALMYVQQFSKEESWWFAGPVADTMTNNVYPNIIEAAIATGSLAKDIRESIMNHNRVFPDGGLFYFP